MYLSFLMFPHAAQRLLPQQPPFQMVDELLAVNEDTYISSFKIQESNVLLEGNFFCEGGMLENMAQTAACGTGYLYLSNQKEVPVGYIGAIKNIQIYDRPILGDVIKTEVTIKTSFGNATIAEAKIFKQEQILASCELTIFIQN